MCENKDLRKADQTDLVTLLQQVLTTNTTNNEKKAPRSIWTLILTHAIPVMWCNAGPCDSVVRSEQAFSLKNFESQV